jgi:hypothetical protein
MKRRISSSWLTLVFSTLWPVRRYPGVAVFHASVMAVTYAKQKLFRIKAVVLLHNP